MCGLCLHRAHGLLGDSLKKSYVQIIVVQLLGPVSLFMTPGGCSMPRFPVIHCLP